MKRESWISNQPRRAMTYEDLNTFIDWDKALAAPRYAGGHEDVMKNIFGDNADVVASWSANDYQGQIAFAYRIKKDGRVLLISDYYGSCSGCDAWEGCSDDSARKMIGDLVNHAMVFDDKSDAIAWLEKLDVHENPEHYDHKATVNLLGGLKNGSEGGV